MKTSAMQEMAIAQTERIQRLELALEQIREAVRPVFESVKALQEQKHLPGAEFTVYLTLEEGEALVAAYEREKARSAAKEE